MIKGEQYVGALDIGSENVIFLLGAYRSQGPYVLANIQFPSEGVRKGVIEDAKALQVVLTKYLAPLYKRYNGLPRDLYLSQNGAIHNLFYETSLSFSGFNHKIEKHDLEEINQLAIDKKLPEHQLFIHHFRQGYRVDDRVEEHPCGQVGNQLSVFYCGVWGNAQAIQTQIHLVNQLGFRVKELVFSGLASALAATTEIERKNGVCVIDIGAEITSFVAFKYGRPLFAGTLPVGGKNFTHDLCSGLRLYWDDGEHLKQKEGIPKITPEETAETFWLYGNQSIGDKQIKVKNLKIILEARAQELFNHIKKQLQEALQGEVLLAGYVLTGGGALLKQIEQVATPIFQADCCIRGPINNGKSSQDGVGPSANMFSPAEGAKKEGSDLELLQSPTYSTAMGLLQYAQIQQQCQISTRKPPLWKRFKAWFS